MWGDLLKIGRNAVQGLQIGAKAIHNEVKYGAKVIKNEVDYTFNNKQDPIGKRPKEALQNTIGQAAQGLAKEFPGVTEALTIASQAAAPVIQSVTDQAEWEAEQGNISPMATLGHGIRSIRGFGNAGAHAAYHTGVDQDVGRFLGEGVAESALTAGLGKATNAVRRAPPLTIGTKPQLAGAAVGGNGLSINPLPPKYQPPQTMELTATRNLAPGVKPGVGSSDDYAEGVKNLRKTQDYYQTKRIKDQQLFEAGKIDEAALQRRNAKTKKMEDAKLSTLPTPDDPDIFEKTRYKNQDPTSEYTYLDQHHGGGSKAMTAPWVKTAMAIGDNDDVVALFELHRSIMGSGMGNAKSAIIDAPTVVHNTANASRSGRNVQEAIHSFMKKGGAGIEIPSEEVLKIIGKPKNMDELLDRYVVFANEYLLPQKQLSLKAVRKEFARHRATLTPDKLDEFDKFVSGINMANTDITKPMH